MLLCRVRLIVPLIALLCVFPRNIKEKKEGRKKKEKSNKKIKNQTLANVCRYVVTWTVRMPSTPVAYSLPDHISSTRSVRVSKNQIKRGLGLLLLLLLLHRNN